MILIPIRAGFPILYCHFYDPPTGCYLHEFDEMLRQNYSVLTQPHHNIDLLSQACGEAELFKSLAESPIDLSDHRVVIEGVIEYMANTESCLLLRDITCPKQRVLATNLYKEFDADDDELTRTRKLRRAFVEMRYKEIVAALYSPNDSVHIDTLIKYEDGRQAHIVTDMRIVSIAD